METMVLLVFLAIVWAAAGIYWLRTRAPQANLSFGGGGRRLGALDAMPTRSARSSRATAPVVALRSSGDDGGSVGSTVTQLHDRGVSGPPGHSLTEPARRGTPGSLPEAQGVSSAQARIRRRNVLVGLVVLAALTLVGIFVVGGTGMILLHLVVDAALLGFVMLLVQYQRAIELDRTRKLPVYAAPRNPLASTGTDGRY